MVWSAQNKRKKELIADYAEYEIKFDELSKSFASPAEAAKSPEFCETLARLREIQNELDLIERLNAKATPTFDVA